MTDMIRKINTMFSDTVREKEQTTTQGNIKKQEEVSIEEVIRRYDMSCK